MTLDIQDIVQVRATIAPGGAVQPEFGRTLLVVTDEELDPGSQPRAQLFADIGEVADVFASDSEAYQAALVYFSQSPYPRPLVVGRWLGVDRNAKLIGGTPGTLADLQAITSGTMTVQGETVTNPDLSGGTSYADVAAAIQTALRASTGTGLSAAEVAFDTGPDVFVVTLGFDSDGNPYDFIAAFADVLTGTLASELGLDEDGAEIVAGHNGESISDAMDAISAEDDRWYFVAADSEVIDTESAVSLAQWVEARPHMLALDTVESGTVTPDESTSVAARLAALDLDRTYVVWSTNSDHKALSMAARLSSIRFDGQNSLISTKFKSLPGTRPDLLNSAQQQELGRKRVNYYTRFGPDAIFAEGWMLRRGTWIDVRFWLDWIVNAIQTEVYNLLRQHPTRVPQTSVGLASIEATIERVCAAGRRNGGIAPGRVSEAVANDIRLATGNPDFSGELTQGYLVSVGSIANQSQADRDARRSPPARVWLKGSGAIHFADIDLIFSG